MAQKKLIGKVVGLNGKTASVQFENSKKHPKYKKIIKKHSKIQAHNENEEVEVGSLVEITEMRPVSKTKAFYVSKVLK